MKMMRFVPVMAAAMLGLVRTTTSSQTALSAAQLIARGDSLIRVGRTDEAEPLFARAVVLAKDSSLLAAGAFGRAYTMQSRISREPDSLREALVDSVIQHYRTASQLDPERFVSPAQNNLGVLRLDFGRPREALSAFLNASRASGSSETAAQYHGNMGRAYEAMNLPDSAAQEYRFALRADSTHIIARRGLLRIYERSFADDSLLAHITRMAASNLDLDLGLQALIRTLSRSNPPTGPAQSDRALVMVASTYAALGMSPEYFARSQTFPLNRALRVHQELSEPISAIRRVLTPVPSKERPLEQVRENWWRATPVRRLAWSTLLRSAGDYYRLKQQNDAAVTYYEAGVGRAGEKIDPAQIDLATFPGLFQSYRALGRIRSIDSVVEILRRDLRDGRRLRGASKESLRDSYFIAGIALLDSQQSRPALEQFKNAILVDSSFAVAYASIGYIYMGLERPDLALAYAQRAVALDPNDPMARNNLGFALFLHGRYREAIEHLEASYLAAPSLLTGINLGLAHRFAGNVEGAIRWHSEAVKEANGDLSNDEAYVSGTWRYSYSPRRAGDVQTIKHSILLEDLKHKRAVAMFALSLDEAVSGKLEQARDHFRDATNVATEPEFRCFFANDIVATRNRLKKRIATEVSAWLEGMRNQLVRGAGCLL